MRLVPRRKIVLAPAAYALLKPFVDCLNARADAPEPPACFVLLHKTQGQYIGADHGPSARAFIPTMDGTTLKLPKQLSPLEPVKDYLTFVVGLDNVANKNSNNNWHDSTCNMFTGSAFTSSKTGPRHESLHWYVANRMKTEPLLLSPFWGPKSESWTTMISAWRNTAGTIKATSYIGQPVDAYAKVFGALRPDTANDPVARANELSRRSMLDYLRADTARLSAAVGAEHRPQIESHLEAIRKIEKDLFDARAGMAPPVGCQPPVPPTTRYPEDYIKELQQHTKTLPERARLLQQIALAAMRCGLYRVIGYDLTGGAGCEDMHPGLWDAGFYNPAPEDRKLGYHFASWHWYSGARGGRGSEWLVNTEQFIMREMFAPIFIGMKDTPSGDTNLLDRSLVAYTTGQSYNHSAHNHTFIVAGRAGGRIKSNRILRYYDVEANQFKPGGRAHNDFLISLLHAWGYTDVTRFGDANLCRGPLAGFV